MYTVTAASCYLLSAVKCPSPQLSPVHVYSEESSTVLSGSYFQVNAQRFVATEENVQIVLAYLEQNYFSMDAVVCH